MRRTSSHQDAQGIEANFGMASSMTPTAGRLRWMVQKNRHLIDSFMLHRAPEFVYAGRPRPLAGEIPVFTFHAVVPDLFEQQCSFLARNGYRTLSAPEFLRCLAGGETPENAIVLTFDDGLKQVWSVAHPILAKYGLRAVCFLVPGCIPQNEERIRPTMADVWRGKAAEADVVGIRTGESPLATWGEIRCMRDAGTFDFHSHTMYHALVPVSDRVFDFAGPHYNTHFFGNIHVPLYTRDGQDVYSREAPPGLPIFYALPRMQADRRFIPDEGLLSRCIERVEAEGGAAFLARGDWRGVLRGIIADHGRQYGRLGRYELPEERDRAVRRELEESRREVEARLPGETVDHLCYPWFGGRPFAVQASREAGYRVGYFGQVPGRPTNRPGQDPLTVARVDELYLERLPGAGRMDLRALIRRMFELRSMPGRILPDRAGAAMAHTSA